VPEESVMWFGDLDASSGEGAKYSMIAGEPCCLSGVGYRIYGNEGSDSQLTEKAALTFNVLRPS
jgi:hypothetical protein